MIEYFLTNCMENETKINNLKKNPPSSIDSNILDIMESSTIVNETFENN